MKKLCIIAALALVCCTLGAQPPQGQQQQPRRNVFDPTNPGAHDPVMAKEGDTYYVFTTGNGISLMTSKDLKTWTPAGSCIPQCPAWIQEKLPNFRGNNFWAPDIIYYQGKWHLFYAASAFGRNTSVIGHATSPTLNPESPDYKWTDQGCMIQSVPYRDMWNAIDANIVIDEDGTPWMDFGSFWNGIMMVKLKDDLRIRSLRLNDSLNRPLVFQPGRKYIISGITFPKLLELYGEDILWDVQASGENLIWD